MTDKTTLLNRITQAGWEHANQFAYKGRWGERRRGDSANTRIENMARDVEEKRTTFVVQKACDDLLAEIERRAAERGYTHLISAPDNWRRNMSITDFIAELRGEVG